MLELRKFTESDYDQLISWVPDARFLMQWAGPKYRFPLNHAQLCETLKKSESKLPSYYVFKAIQVPNNDVIGHIQLMDVDYKKLTCMLGRVLIGVKDLRGNGYGHRMVQLAVKYAFEEAGLHEVRLGVFDFNCSAISCYQRIGFVQYEFREKARKLDNEYWNIIRMKLHKDQWLKDPNL